MLAVKPVSVIVPNILGLTNTGAVSAISGVGLIPGIVTSAYSATVPVGLVVSQNPIAASSVAPSSPVSYVLSLGPAPVAVAVPNVLGLAELAADAALIAAGFNVSTVYVYTAGAAFGIVTAQSPVGGTPEFLPFTVIITVSIAQAWPVPSPITNLPGRGCWPLPGGTQCLWVFGNSCYLMSSTFGMAKVGTLNTTSGPVCIRDNGPGGYAVIVDGPYGYTYNIATQAFAQITDTGFLGADRVAFIDGWLIFNRPGTQTFYTTGPVAYTITFPGSFFALKDGSTDNLVTLFENKEELWLIGERTSEIWYNAGGAYFAFQRLVSTMLQTGCSAKHSIARYAVGNESGLVFLGNSERGQNVIVKTQGFAVVSITTPAVAAAIAKYSTVSDAIGYVYQEGGHEFYVLTFPTADVTWCFDFSTNMWHKRLSYDPYAPAYHRHRSNCFANFQNQRLVGDYQNGSVYRLDRTVYTDAGWPLVAWRRTPHIWDGKRGRTFVASLQIEFAPGVGTQTGLGQDPQAILTISRDGGTTFGSEFKRAMGKVGAYLNRVIWRKLRFARDMVIDVKVIDPVNRDIVGAEIREGSDG